MTMPNQLGQIALSGGGGTRDKGGERERERVGREDDVHRDVSRKRLGARDAYALDAGIYMNNAREGLLSVPAAFLFVASRRDRDESYMHERRTFPPFSLPPLPFLSPSLFLSWSRYAFSRERDLCPSGNPVERPLTLIQLPLGRRLRSFEERERSSDRCEIWGSLFTTSTVFTIY